MYKQFGNDSEQVRKFPDSEMDGSEMNRVDTMGAEDEMIKMGSIHERDRKDSQARDNFFD